MFKKKLKYCLMLLLFFTLILSTFQSNEVLSTNAKDITIHEFKAVIESTGKIEVLPDLAEPYIQIEYVDISKSESQNTCNQIAENVANYLENIGIKEKDICFNNTYTYPINNYGNEAFKTCINLSFKTSNLTNLEQVLSELNTEYIKICNINYSNTKFNSHYLKALAVAQNNALVKAKSLYPEREIILTEVCEKDNYNMPCMYREYNERISEQINKPLEIEAKVSITVIVK